MASSSRVADGPAPKPTSNMKIKLKRKKIQEAYMGHIISPSWFYIRLEHYDAMLHKLVADIQEYVTPMIRNRNVVFKPNDICVAHYDTDGLYYRARVQQVEYDEYTGDVLSYFCFFVDYGNYTSVDVEFVFPILKKFVKQLPFQAIECTMHGVKTISDEEIKMKANRILEELFFETEDSVDYLNIMFVKLMKVTNMKSHIMIYTKKPTFTESASPVNDLIKNFVKEQLNEREENGGLDEATNMTNNEMDDFNSLLDTVNLNLFELGDTDTDTDEWNACFEFEDNLSESREPSPETNRDLFEYFMQLNVNQDHERVD